MQPPPRKAKAATVLRNLHNEQINKLLVKHQQDAEFLDDLRNFTKGRASIEKEYGQALFKLASTHLQRKVPNYSEFKSSAEDQRTVYTVWKTLLDETEKIGKARLAAAEVYHQQISESAKNLRTLKLQTAKKCFENIRRMQEELQQCVQELDKNKKLYFEEEHMAHDAREKAHDAEEKLKRKRGRIFQSISSLQKNTTKFSFRREACDIQATKARNDYILSLVAANAHQTKFYEVDLPEVLQNLDCDMYEKIQDYLQLMSRTELLTCAACHSSFTIVQEQANTVTRQYTIDCFLQDNPVIAQSVQYHFDPCDNDQIEKISIEHNAALCLSKEAKKWCTCIAKEKRTLRHCWQELNKYRSLLQERLSNSEPQQPGDPAIAELEAKIDELKNTIRRAETSKLKADARIEALREGGVGVDEFVIPDVGPQDSVVAPDSRSGTLSSRSSRRSDDQSEGSEGNQVNYVPPVNADYEDSDYGEESHSRSASVEPEEPPVYAGAVVCEEDVVASVTGAWEDEPSATSDFSQQPVDYDSVPSVRCVALFAYQATNPDELSFEENEELEVLGDGDGDGWIRARNFRGEVGFIPQNYVQVAGDANAISFQEEPPPLPMADYPPPREEPQDLVVNGVVPPTAVEPAEEELPPFPAAEEEGELCVALYDYEATCEEELTFEEGAMIRVLSREVHGVDDGWWHGRLEDGTAGIFPSLVVEPIASGDTVTSPGEKCAPPAFTPPQPEFLLPPSQVILTQPTPEIEEAPVIPPEGGPPVVVHQEFHIELRQQQQDHYQSQLAEAIPEDGEQDLFAELIAEKAAEISAADSKEEKNGNSTGATCQTLKDEANNSKPSEEEAAKPAETTTEKTGSQVPTQKNDNPPVTGPPPTSAPAHTTMDDDDDEEPSGSSLL